MQKHGVEYTNGKLGDIVIERLTFYTRGVVIDTRSSTGDCDTVLKDLLAWIQELAGVADPVRIIRWTYASQMVVESEHSLALVSPRLTKLATTARAKSKS